MGNPDRSECRDDVQRYAKCECSLDSHRGQQNAADDWSKDAAPRIGCDVKRHSGAQAIRTDHLTDDHPADGRVGGPPDPVDEDGNAYVPDGELTGMGENCQRARTRKHRQYDRDDARTAFHPVRDDTKQGTEQCQRQRPKQSHEGDEKG